MSSRVLTTLTFLVLSALLLAATACTGQSSDVQPATAQADDRPEPLGEQLRGRPLEDGLQIPDLELIDHNGNPFNFSKQDDEIVALFFGYTHCPDVCPLTLGFITQASRELGPSADNVQFLFVTVDPERDTPEKLREYVGRVDANIVGLTGEPDQLAKVWDAFDIFVEKKPRDDGGYFVDHSAQILLADQSGQLRVVVPMGADGQDLLNDVRWLLRQNAAST